MTIFPSTILKGRFETDRIIVKWWIEAITGGAVYNGLPLFKAVVINEIGIEQSPIFVKNW